MPLKLVTDPELLKQLNSEEPSQPQQKPLRLVTDPELLRQLNEEEPQESYGEKLKAAPGKIASDLGDLIFQRIRDIPNYLEKSKTEIPGFVESYFKHPVSMLRQEVAGGNEAINALAQTPLNIAKYGSNRLGLIPQSATNALEKITPEDTTQAINQVFGQPTHEGESLARGVVRNLPSIVPAVGTARLLNPLKLTSKNIAKDILNTRSNMQNLYSQKYNDSLTNAHQSGLGQTLPQAVNAIDFNTALINEPKKVKARIDELQTNPNVLTAHEAKKDLLKIQRKLTNKNESVGLIGNEPAQLDAVNDAIGKIESNMFTDAQGNINKDAANQYRQIQQGYAKEVIPYTKNKAINEYRRGEKLADQLVKSLQSGKFPAQRGQKYHKALEIRRQVQQHPVIASALGLSGSAGLAKLLYDALIGRNQNE